MCWQYSQATRHVRVDNLAAKSLLMYLAILANDDGYCFPSQKTISEECEMGTSTVKRAMKILIDKGLLQIADRYRDGKRTSNGYFLNLCQDIDNKVEQKPVETQVFRTESGSPDRTHMGSRVEWEGVQSGLQNSTTFNSTNKKHVPYNPLNPDSVGQPEQLDLISEPHGQPCEDVKNPTLVPDDAPKKPAKEAPDQVLAAIPEALDTAEFRKWWGEFIAHRRETKKPITGRSAKLLFGKLEEYSVETSIEALKRSIENQWQGVFPDKIDQQSSSGRSQPYEDNGITDDPSTWPQGWMPDDAEERFYRFIGAEDATPEEVAYAEAHHGSLEGFVPSSEHA